MKIIFINPPNEPFTEKSILIEPIDIIQVANYTRSLGHDVSFLDMDVKSMMPSDLKEKTEEGVPDVAVIVFDYHIPLHTHHTYDSVMELAEIYSSQGVKVVIGGKMATFQSDKFLFDGSPVDVCCLFDLEIPLAGLLSNEERDDSFLSTVQNIRYFNETVQATLFHKTPFDLNYLPVAQRDICDLEEYIEVRTILSSRGCPMTCTFCHVPGFWGRRRSRSASHVVDEIEYLVNTHGAKKVLFLDDNTTVNKKRMIEISKEIINRRVKVWMGCLGTIHNYDTEMMKWMFEAGFRRIHYGIESGDHNVSKQIRKFLSNDAIQEVVGETKEIGFRVRTSWILDLPDVTIDSFNQTADFIKTLKTDEVRLHFLAIRLGSDIYDTYYAESDTPVQYIHHGSSNYTLHNIDTDLLKASSQQLVEDLQEDGYALVKNIEDNRYFSTWDTHDTKVVSLCPLRYGINRQKHG